MPEECGIYRIIVTRPGKPARYYIGQSRNIHIRSQTHLWGLATKRSKNPAMQRAYDRYGKAAFSFEVLQLCEADGAVLAQAEKIWLDAQIAETGPRSVFNVLRRDVRSRLGMPQSAASNAKRSATQKGRKATPEQIEKNRLGHLGKKLTPESIAKRTAKQTGRIVSPTTRAKHAAAILGTTRSAETRAKISASKKGWKPSVDHLERLRTMRKGCPMPPHLREKLLAIRTGSKKPPEEIARRQATRAANRAAKLSQL